MNIQKKLIIPPYINVHIIEIKHTHAKHLSFQHNIIILIRTIVIQNILTTLITEEIKTLFEKKEINKILRNNPTIFLLNTTIVKEKMSSSLDITMTKKDNLKHNRNNTLKK